MKKLYLNLFIAAVLGAFTISAFNVLLIRYGALSFSTETFGHETIKYLPAVTIIYNFLFLLSGLFLYEYLNKTYPRNELNKYGLFISNLLIGLSIAFAYLGHTKPYTLLTFVLLIVVLVYIEYRNKLRFMYRFYRAYCVFLIPVVLINWIMISKNMMTNYPATRLELNIGLIPFENFFYMLVMFLISVLTFEKLQTIGRK